MNYQLIYDGSKDTWGILIFLPLGLAVAGLTLICFRGIRNRVLSKAFEGEMKAIKDVLGFCIICGGILYIGIPITGMAYGHDQQVKSMMETGKLKIAEGRVSNYHAMPPEGHSTEHFTVDNVEFEFSNSPFTEAGYRKPACSGGKIKQDEFVRITYYNFGEHTRNVIAKLEIAEPGTQTNPF